MHSPAVVPDISHMSYRDWDSVYEPAEDTFLFLDSLKEESSFLKTLQPTICLEIGCGSGCVVTYLSQLLRSLLPNMAPPLLFATDINIRAAQVATRTALRNGVSLDVVCTDLTEAVHSRLTGIVDIIVFNPPYVPSPQCEVGSRGIEATWAGGIDGREVIDRTLPLIKELLSPIGVFYLVVVIENKPKELAEAAARIGLSCQRVAARNARMEKLSVLKFTHSGQYIDAHIASLEMTRTASEFLPAAHDTLFTRTIFADIDEKVDQTIDRKMDQTVDDNVKRSVENKFSGCTFLFG